MRQEQNLESFTKYCKSNKNSKIINSNENDISTLISDIKKELDKKLSKTKMKSIGETEHELCCILSHRL